MKNWAKYVALPGIVIATAFAACDDINTEPQLEPNAGIHAILNIVEQKGYVVAKETDLTVGTVSATIGEYGGELKLGSKYKLTVPAGAVSAPTVFSMSKLDGDHARFSLTATRGLIPNNVGEAGFAKPLTLSVSYAGVENLPSDLSALKVFWLKTDGSSEAQPSVVDVTGQRVDGELTHFSDYFIGFPIE